MKNKKTKKKICDLCKGYGVYNECAECGKISNPIYGKD